MSVIFPIFGSTSLGFLDGFGSNSTGILYNSTKIFRRSKDTLEISDLIGDGTFNIHSYFVDVQNNIYTCEETGAGTGLYRFKKYFFNGNSATELWSYNNNDLKVVPNFGSGLLSVRQSIVVDSQFNIYVGYTGTTGTDKVLVKLDKNGNEVWSKTANEISSDTGQSVIGSQNVVNVKIDSQGAVYGAISNGINISNGFFKYDSNGVYQWFVLRNTLLIIITKNLIYHLESGLTTNLVRGYDFATGTEQWATNVFGFSGIDPEVIIPRKDSKIICFSSNFGREAVVDTAGVSTVVSTGVTTQINTYGLLTSASSEVNNF